MKKEIFVESVMELLPLEPCDIITSSNGFNGEEDIFPKITISDK